MLLHAAPPTAPDTRPALAAPSGADLDLLRRRAAHARRSRLARFWRVAGPIRAAQFLLFALFLAYGLVVGVRSGVFIAAAAILIAPCILAYFMRNLFLRHLRSSLRALNLAGACLYAFFLYLLFARPTLPVPVSIAILAYLPFHASTMFWILSDPRMCPTRDRWWHGKG